MKKILLGLAVLFPLQAISADDSVYTWGTWSQGIKPAAGPVVHVATPSPAQTPNANVRANEHSVFVRSSEESVRMAAAEVARQVAEANARVAASVLANLSAAAAANGSSLVTGSQVVITTAEQANSRRR